MTKNDDKWKDANLKDWLLDAADGEAIEAVVIGELPWGSYNSDDVPGYDQQPRGVVLSWEEALKWIDYKFYSGFGAPGCNAVYAWTSSNIIGISAYDGSTDFFVIPRHPTPCVPYMPGGS